MAFETADAAIIFATLAGPVLAVQAQKWLERGRAISDRRNAIFRTLMATRGSVLSPAHVEALNAVPVEFYGTKGALKHINEAWKVLVDHHEVGVITNEAWAIKRQDLFLNVLHLISQYLGYDFSRSQLDRDIWNPKAHGDLETEQAIIRRGFVKLFNGEASLPMAVTEFPATLDDDALAAQAEIQKALLDVLRGKKGIKIEPPK